MNEIGGLQGTRQVQVGTDATEATGRTQPATAPVDTGVPAEIGMPRTSAAELPPSNGPIDYGLAISAVGTMSESVGVDFGRIAALMMMIDSELSRAARDSQVAQIEEVASEMHKSADDLRASAKMALIGGCVSGATQIASAGITIGGGVKGMSLTRASINVGEGATPMPTEETPTAPTEEPSAPVEESGAPAESVRAESGGGAEQPEPTKEVAEETRQEDVQETSEQDAKAKAKAKLESLDQAVSHQLSARAQNIALVTQGVSQITSSTGEIIKSALEYESKLKDAASKEDDARAEEKRSYMERTKAFADSMQKGAQDMIQVYQQMSDSMHQTSSQVWSRA